MFRDLERKIFVLKFLHIKRQRKVVAGVVPLAVIPTPEGHTPLALEYVIKVWEAQFY